MARQSSSGTVQPTSVLTTLLVLAALLVVGLSSHGFPAAPAATADYAAQQAAAPAGPERSCDGLDGGCSCCHGQAGPGGGVGWFAATQPDIPAPDGRRLWFASGRSAALSRDAMEPAVPPPRLSPDSNSGTRTG